MRAYLQIADQNSPLRTLVLHSLGMEQPLLWAEDKLDQAKELVLPTSRCQRPITTDIGEVNRSDQTQGGSSIEEPCQTQWVRAERKHHTCAADGFAPYDPAEKRKDNTLLLRRLREKPVFFRKNVPTNAHAALQEACLGNAPGHEMETTNSLGIALVFVSTIFFSCASVFVKLNSDMPSVESGCIRSIYSVVFSGNYLLIQQECADPNALAFTKPLGDLLEMPKKYIDFMEMGVVPSICDTASKDAKPSTLEL